MKNILKKTSLAVLTAATILSAVPVFGGNLDWGFNASSPGGVYRTSVATKTTDKSILVNYSGGPSSYVSVTAWALVNGTYKNCTLYNNAHPYYSAYKGPSYIGVLNTVYEKYGKCGTCIDIVALKKGAHAGKWRPDA